MASKKAKLFWEIGVPLNDAWLKFAPSELGEDYDRAPGFIEALSRISDFEGWVGFMKAFHTASSASIDKQKLEKHLKDELLTDLYNEQLIATGYRISPSRSGAPVQIDPEDFSFHEPNWKLGTFEANGIKYGNLRICDPDAITLPKKPSRGSGEVINLAISDLIRDNAEFCQMPRKSACQLVRETLGVEHSRGNGLSNTNIEKYIVANCGKKRISAN